MAAFVHTETGVIKHVEEGSWRHDYMQWRTSPWRPATAEEIAADIAARLGGAAESDPPTSTVDDDDAGDDDGDGGDGDDGDGDDGDGDDGGDA
jgi:hypothetical protein